MLSSEYFRRQADICLRLSVISSSEEAASQLIVMAHEYQTKADALEAHTRSPSAYATGVAFAIAPRCRPAHAFRSRPRLRSRSCHAGLQMQTEKRA
jgi:hypothetical protein